MESWSVLNGQPSQINKLPVSKGLVFLGEKKTKSRFWLQESLQMLSYGLHWPHTLICTNVQKGWQEVLPLCRIKAVALLLSRQGTDTGTMMYTYLLSEGSRPRACGCRLPRTTVGPWRLALEPVRVRWSSWLRCRGTEVRTADTTWPVIDSVGPLGREPPRAR